MRLLGNYSIIHKSPGSYRLGPSNSSTFGNKRKSGTTFKEFLLFGSELDSEPMGYGGESIIPPQAAGGLAATFITAAGSLNAPTLVPALPLSASLTAEGTATAVLALIVNLEASITATGTVSTSILAIIAQLSANITASGTVTTADLSNIINMTAALSASGALSTAALTTLKNLSANITSATELSPENLAAEILNALLVDFNQSGSVGEALNNIGASSNPWSSDLSTNNTAGTFGKRIQEILTKNDFIGLK